MKTKSIISSRLNNLNDTVIQLTDCYKQNNTSQNLKALVEKTLEFCVLLRRLEFSHNNTLLQDFDEDVCLEYIGLVLSGRILDDPWHKLRGIIAKRAYQQNKTSIHKLPGIDFLIDNSTVSYIENRLNIRDVLKIELENVSEKVYCLISYYLNNFNLLKNFIINYPDSIDKYTVVLKVYSIRKQIMNEAETTFDINFSKDRIANLLMLSGLFNKSPEMFVLLTLLGDFRKFLTFISLFEGKQVDIPKISDINEVFQKSSLVSTNFSAGSLSIQDKQNLLTLVTNVSLDQITPEVKPNKFLDEYLAELVASSVKSWNTISEKQFKYLDFTNAKKVKEAYDIANIEIASQLRLLKELASTMSTIKEINSAIEHIKKNQ